MNFTVRLCLLAALFGGSSSVSTACDIADVDVEITKTAWYKRCSKKNCAELKGVVVLTSRCAERIGVHIRLTGPDPGGVPIVIRESWPYALSKLSAGDYSFSLYKCMKHNAEIRHFRIQVIQMRPVDR